MTTRLDIRTSVRRELNDISVSAPLYSDVLLNGWFDEGITQLSIDLPVLKQVILGIAADCRILPLTPSVGVGTISAAGVRSVEAPPGHKLARGDTGYRTNAETTTNLYTPTGTENYPHVFNNVWDFQIIPVDNPLVPGATIISPAVVFRYAPFPTGTVGEYQVIVWYWTGYTPVGGDGLSLDISPYDEMLLLYFICGRAISWLAEQRGKRNDSLSMQNRDNASYYERLYAAGIKLRQDARYKEQVALDASVAASAAADLALAASYQARYEAGVKARKQRIKSNVLTSN
jgi:hypothetical protein